MPITIHAIFHAHLDPVWMWPWTAGLDEAIATSRSACDQLDAFADLFYTQGEVWPFAMIERADPALFARIRKHVESGRWEVVNGWWVQPDCNFPTADGLRRQIQIGQSWIKNRFGLSTRCGFNPDSFGHCAKLPEILRELGQDRYVFMRPQEHEMDLPARIFTWRTRPDGAAVTVFRIADTYINGLDGGIWMAPLKKCVAALPEGCCHTMVMMGVGNHGGGPTRRLVRWVKENPGIIPGAKIEFSTVNRFFDALEKQKPHLPDVTGELQIHAVGCYSAMRSNKTLLRRAEHALLRAETVAAPDDRPRLERAWQQVCAHQFHDTLGGTAIPEAYPFVDGQLAGAAAEAEEITAYAVRRQITTLPDDPLPRLILANPGDAPFSGWAEATAYLEGIWRNPWRLLDPAGREIPFQQVPSGAGVPNNWFWTLRRVLVRADIPANALHTLRLDLSQPPAPIVPQVKTSPTSFENLAGASLDLASGTPALKWNNTLIATAQFHLIADPTDTWSHSVDRYPDTPESHPRWDAPRLQDTGPLMASLLQSGAIGQSRLSAEWRIYADEPWIDLLLDILWAERQKILKLVLPASAGPTRIDGTPGLALSRPNSGRECPLHDFTHFGPLAVISPDIFALDATPARLRLTLLRSPLMAHHDNEGPNFPRGVVSDQGVHRFHIRFHFANPTAPDLARHALAMHRPPLAAEFSRGMPARWTEYTSPTQTSE